MSLNDRLKRIENGEATREDFEIAQKVGAGMIVGIFFLGVFVGRRTKKIERYPFS